MVVSSTLAGMTASLRTLAKMVFFLWESSPLSYTPIVCLATLQAIYPLPLSSRVLRILSKDQFVTLTFPFS